MDLSECTDRIVHLRYLGVIITVKDYSNHNTTQVFIMDLSRFSDEKYGIFHLKPKGEKCTHIHGQVYL